MTTTIRKPSRQSIESHQRKVNNARKAYDQASSALITWAIDNGHGHVRRSDLTPILSREVPEMLVKEYRAKDALDQAEQSATDAWCAWRGTFGLLFWN